MLFSTPAWRHPPPPGNGVRRNNRLEANISQYEVIIYSLSSDYNMFSSLTSHVSIYLGGPEEWKKIRKTGSKNPRKKSTKTEHLKRKRKFVIKKPFFRFRILKLR